MRLCIHRGTHEIGGTCVEMEAGGKRIVLDIGLPLDIDDPEEVPLYPIAGFAAPDPSLLGVFISHPHRDHYGLAHRLPNQTTFLIGKAAESILAAADLFTGAGLKLQNVIHLADHQPVRLGPFTLTPYLVDHSAYDAYALLVEAEDKRLFYSGDFRGHGRKAALFERLLAQAPSNVDVLLMEGTTLGRADAGTGFPTETDLEWKFVELFKKTAGLLLVWCSGQNIDRLVTIYRACKRTGRTFIVDMYTAHILAATGNRSLPQQDWPLMRIFLPRGQKRTIVRKQAFEVSDQYRPYRIFPEQLAAAAPHSVMLFRPTMIHDLEEADGQNGAAWLKGTLLIYSMWDGYLKDAANKPLLDWLAARGIPLEKCHTSGHAGIADLLRLRQAFPTALVLPVHSPDPDAAAELLHPAFQLTDGHWHEL